MKNSNRRQRRVITGKLSKDTEAMNARRVSDVARYRRKARWGIEDVDMARELGITVEEVRAL